MPAFLVGPLLRLGLIFFVLVGSFGYGYYEGRAHELDRQSAMAAKARDEAAKETQRRLEAKESNIREAQDQTKQAKSDLSRVGLLLDRTRAALSSRLREHELSAGRATDPAASPGSPAGSEITDLCLGIGDAARWAAEKADSAYIAGKACERQYDSLTNRVITRTRGTP